ncbi:hypothetical protein RHGRI_004972 [Rhododendron griersonianum]|uniref:DUF659 domain-containing protein n=1 Tax=Rhododendron griersonianum TaxID=479676 RepID=A0AAV6LBM5_9ERIC|nr:hypothetical protein RHGRI_004972 [Rhododendron griersonianum]
MSFETGGFRMEGYETRKRKASGTTAIDKAFNPGAREQLHSEIARMFYSGGLPFHLSRNPYYVSAFQYAANNLISGYVPPGYNLLRTTLLQKERANVERLLEPTRKSWNEKGLSVVTDGWTDSQRRPLITFMAASEAGAMFLKAVNCEGEHKDKFFISELMTRAIEDVGPQNVVQVITDNAPVCSAAGALIEGKYPKIFWTPCVVHTLNLALKNICAPKQTGDTRFASDVVMLKRFKLIKRGLQSMVISEKWVAYKEDNFEKAHAVRTLLLKEEWWGDIDYILSFTLPIYEMLRACDTDKPCLHLVYEMWDAMIEKVRAAIYKHENKDQSDELVFYSVVHNILVDRWAKSNTPLHCLAHSLNPRYYSTTWLDENPERVPPHRDEEISSMRNKCFQRYFPNPDERRVVNVEYAKFSGCLENFGDYDSRSDRGALEPLIWWFAHGSPAPTLQSLALKLLSQPSSSPCCERNWSTYSFILSIKRNKMTPQRAEDLVYVHNNLRLLSRRTRVYTEGDNKLWDVGGDAFDSLEGAGILEIANLSLDEPDMEAVLFTDEGEGDAIEVDN